MPQGYDAEKGLLNADTYVRYLVKQRVAFLKQWLHNADAEIKKGNDIYLLAIDNIETQIRMLEQWLGEDVPSNYAETQEGKDIEDILG